MQMMQLEEQDLGVVFKLFGALFYYQPQEYAQMNVSAFFDDDGPEIPVKSLSELLDTFKQTSRDMLQLEHDRLFSGCGAMPAPPWGSAYLDKEAVLFGDSTIEYRYFLHRSGLLFDSGLKEPEDQIGLMLMVLGMFFEAGQIGLVKEMLRVHLMTWFGFFIRRFRQVVELPAYRQLADQTEILLGALCQRYDVIPIKKRDYRDEIARFD
jgi:TorA maturation chaperone TorD